MNSIKICLRFWIKKLREEQKDGQIDRDNELDRKIEKKGWIKRLR